MTDRKTKSKAEGHPRITCVVRSVGERTTALCVELLEDELGEPPEVVSIPVHRDMVKRCLELGIEHDADLLIVVDADVLTYRGGIQGLLRLYDTIPSGTFSLVPRIDDHLLGKERPGGLRMYRGALLAKALEFLPKSSQMRPESGLMAPMAAAGHPSVMAESVWGLHDAGQYLVDIYRKGGFYGHRNVRLVPELLDRWRSPASEDEYLEFRAALLGLADGLVSLHRGPDFAEHLAEVALAALESRGISERPALDPAARAEIAARLPEPRLSDRWWTYPTPTSTLGKLRESRRLKRSILRTGLSGALRRCALAVENSSSRTS